MEISNSFWGIGWKLLKNTLDYKAVEAELLDEAYHEYHLNSIAAIKIREYPCFVFVHACYDESTDIEILCRDDLEKMLLAIGKE